MKKYLSLALALGAFLGGNEPATGLMVLNGCVKESASYCKAHCAQDGLTHSFKPNDSKCEGDPAGPHGCYCDYKNIDKFIGQE